jgi:hypothetical protein
LRGPPIIVTTSSNLMEVVASVGGVPNDPSKGVSHLHEDFLSL